MGNGLNGLGSEGTQVIRESKVGTTEMLAWALLIISIIINILIFLGTRRKKKDEKKDEGRSRSSSWFSNPLFNNDDVIQQSRSLENVLYSQSTGTGKLDKDVDSFQPSEGIYVDMPSSSCDMGEDNDDADGFKWGEGHTDGHLYSDIAPQQEAPYMDIAPQPNDDGEEDSYMDVAPFGAATEGEDDDDDDDEDEDTYVDIAPVDLNDNRQLSNSSNLISGYMPVIPVSDNDPTYSEPNLVYDVAGFDVDVDDEDI